MKRLIPLAMFFLSTLFAAAQTDLNRGLVAWYPFNGNANDISGNNLHGIEQNGASLTTDKYGNPNSAYLLDGVDDYIEIPDNLLLHFRDSFSVCISYMKLSQPGGALIEKRDMYTGTNSSFDMAAGSGGANGSVKTMDGCGDALNGWVYTGFTQPPVLNQWYCLVMTFNAGTLNLYQDGVLISSNNANWLTVDSCEGSNIRIGYHLSFDPIPFNGKVDDVRLYNRALNFEEINSLCGSSSPADTGVVINSWTPVAAYDSCTNKLTVEDAAAFKNGDTVLIIQMKGAAIDSTNSSSFGSITDYKSAGNYEFNYIKSINGNDIELQNILTRTYEIPAGAVQLVRVPYYDNIIVSSKLTCIPWDGAKGGVLVLNGNNITLNAGIDVSGKGFRGGDSLNLDQPDHNCPSNDYYYQLTDLRGAPKGEGIAVVGDDKSYGKGNLANGGGGGNSHNAGGGGGSNAAAGGYGGYQLEAYPCYGTVTDSRGIAGSGLLYNGIENRIFLGGGGGAGHANNPERFGSPGGNGGGIVIINAQTITANNQQVTAKGDNGLPCNLSGASACHEGMGGGGAGGTVLLNINSITGNMNVDISGGNGSDMIAGPIYTRVGPGGGGSGGICWCKGSTPLSGVTVDAHGGANGICTQINNSNWGALPGDTGTILNQLSIVTDTVPFVPCGAALRVISFTATVEKNSRVILKWTIEKESGVTDYVIERAEAGGSFSGLGSVKAAYNNAADASYQFADLTAKANIPYQYRIKIVKNNGLSFYSVNREALLKESRFYAVLAPNPAHNTVSVQLSGTEGSSVIKMFTYTGQLLLTKTVSQNNTTAINLSALAAGCYFLQITNGANKILRQLIKQ